MTMYMLLLPCVCVHVQVVLMVIESTILSSLLLSGPYTGGVRRGSDEPPFLAT